MHSGTQFYLEITGPALVKQGVACRSEVGARRALEVDRLGWETGGIYRGGVGIGELGGFGRLFIEARGVVGVVG